jgi:type II secretory pathway component PulF
MTEHNRSATNGDASLTGSEGELLGGQLTALAGGALPLVGALRALAEESARPRLAGALTRVADRVQRGAALDDALAAERGVPRPLRAALVETARRGDAQAWLGYLDYERRLDQLGREARLAMFYPACVLTLLTIVLFLFLSVFAQPNDAFFEDFDVEVPLATQLFVLAGRHVWQIAVAALVSAVAGAAIWRWILPDETKHRLYKQTPLLGGLWRFRTLAGWSRLMSVLIDARTRLDEALRFAGQSALDVELGAASLRAADVVETGQSLSAALATEPAFPPSLAPMVGWGESERQLSESLRAAADLFEARARRQVSLVEVVLPAIAFLMVVWCVVVIVTATVMPLYWLIEALS